MRNVLTALRSRLDYLRLGRAWASIPRATSVCAVVLGENWTACGLVRTLGSLGASLPGEVKLCCCLAADVPKDAASGVDVPIVVWEDTWLSCACFMPLRCPTDFHPKWWPVCVKAIHDWQSGATAVLLGISPFRLQAAVDHESCGTGSPEVVWQQTNELHAVLFGRDALRVAGMDAHCAMEASEWLARLHRTGCGIGGLSRGYADFSLVRRSTAAGDTFLVPACPVHDGWERERSDAYLGRLRAVPPVACGQTARSDEPLSVVVLATNSDLDVLPHCVAGIRAHLRHPVKSISLVCPMTSELLDMGQQLRCELVDENSLLPLQKSDIEYRVDGLDRSGWLFQQLLKFAISEVVSTPAYLVVDADTMFVSPQAFVVGGRDLLLLGDCYNGPYFPVFSELTGELPIYGTSFVCHQMLFRKAWLSELLAHISTRHGTSWWHAILACTDRSVVSGFSEYETYGHWVLRHHGDDVVRSYFANRDVSREELVTGRVADAADRMPLRSVSAHAYREAEGA